jgi:putative nucleotidyltransferase with HDIG domain
MSNGPAKRTRLQRVATVELPPAMWERLLAYLQRGDVLFKLSMCLLTAVALWAITGSWRPSLGYRTGYTPRRAIVAQVAFRKADEAATREAKDRARRRVRHVYENDPEPLIQLRAQLKNRITSVLAAKSLDELDRAVWQEFFAPTPLGGQALTEEEREWHFQRFRAALADPAEVEKLDAALATAMKPLEQHGLIDKLPPEHDRGNQMEINVHPRGKPELTNAVPISEVLIGDADSLRRQLQQHLASPEVAARVFDWLRPRLPSTLTYSRAETQAAMDAAEAKVEDQFLNFKPGDILAPGGKPITPDELSLLQMEHQARDAALTLRQRLSFSLATFGMFIALATLCGIYAHHYEPSLLTSGRHFGTLIGLIVVTVGLAVLVSGNAWRAEVVPLIIFGMIMTLAYHQETAMLFSAAMAMIITVALGQSLPEFITLSAAVVTAILLTTNIRSRSKLIYVGLCAGAVAALTHIGVGTLDEQPIRELSTAALYYGVWTFVAAGFIMTGLLPFIESIFAVQTEISLLELGDVAHPLLQELVRRAPGTYNHSINVASIAEAAADSIGANGLLVRVGAYFHDIGKMLKPQYFVENQGSDSNRHDQLMPAMSTLIIIAHIKDGADLARQHHLPQPIIDFIQQHHGTTLVEFFYRRAKNDADPDGPDVEEAAFRYPGPKPQTKEAAVLMLADAVESACRALVEPNPSRIESLVHELAMKRLLDGQFDECGLTLSELATIQESLVKSLTAVYHGRIKYPDQRSA